MNVYTSTRTETKEKTRNVCQEARTHVQVLKAEQGAHLRPVELSAQLLVVVLQG